MRLRLGNAASLGANTTEARERIASQRSARIDPIGSCAVAVCLAAARHVLGLGTGEQLDEVVEHENLRVEIDPSRG